MAKAPWYKRYASDFVSDPYVQAMTAEQYGWYSAALDMMWIHTPQGKLPNDVHLLCKMIGRCDELHFATHAQIVIERFKTSEDGKWLYHPKMIEQVEHISEVSEKRRDAAKTRHGNKPKVEPNKSNANAEQKQTDSDLDSDIKRGKENPPENLHPLHYATRLCEDFGIPKHRNGLDPVAAAVEAAALFFKIPIHEAYSKLHTAATIAQSSGTNITHWWFADGKWKTVEPPKPTAIPLHLKVRAEMEAERQEKAARRVN